MPVDLSNLPDPGKQASTVSLDTLPDSYASILRQRYRAAQNSPDQAARINTLAQRSGLPPVIVANHTQEAEKRASEPDWQNLEHTAPLTVRALAHNPKLFAIAHDDTDALSGIEQTVKAMPYAAAKGLGGSFNRFAASANLVAGALPTVYDRIASAITGKTQTGAEDWWFRHMVAPQIANQRAFQVAPNAPFALKAAHTAGDLLGMLSQIILTGGGGEGVALAPEATGAEALRAAAEHGAKSLAFPALSDAVNTGREVYQRTGDADQALRAATAQYATTTGFGVIPLAAPGRLLTRLAGGAASGAVAGEISRQGMNLALPPSLQQPFDPEQLLLSGLAGSVLALGGPGAPRALHEGIRRTYEDAHRAAVAEDGFNKLQTLNEQAAAAKTRGRDSEVFKEFMNTAQEEGERELYVDAHTLDQVLQQSGIPEDEIAAQMPDVAKQLPDARVTTADVRIPLTDFATHLAGTPAAEALLPHIKFEPDGATYAEAQTFYQAQAEELQRRAKDILSRAGAESELQQSADQVFQQIKSDLEATGRFTPDIAAKYAALHRAFAVTRGEQVGMLPHEIYQRYGLRVQTGEPGVAHAAQGGTNLNQGEVPSLVDLGRQMGIKLHMHQRGDVLTVDKMVVPKDLRGLGHGSEFMQRLADFADAHGLTLALTPSGDFGSNIKRLRSFYKRFGFHENKGRNKDYAISESMYRRPGKPPTGSEFYQGSGKLPENFAGLDVNELSGDEYDKAVKLFEALGRERTEARDQGLHDDNRTVARTRPDPAWSGATALRTDGTPTDFFHGSETALQPQHFEREALGHASGHPTSGLGVFFTDSGSDAERYGPHIESFHLDIRNPAEFTVGGGRDLPTFNSLDEAHAFREQLRAAGHDGITIDARGIGGPLWAVAFDPNQVIHPAATFEPGVAHAAQGGLELTASLGPEQGREGGSPNALTPPASIRSPDTLYKQSGEIGPRASIAFPKDWKGPAIINLPEQADLSSFLHESGHFFLEVTADLARAPDAPPAIKQDLQTLLDWFGVKSWDEVGREQHEKFARGFEAYLFEGKAPSLELHGVFSRFRAWLVSVYRSLRGLNVQLTPEVRRVMDRMFASEEAIQSAEHARGYVPLFKDAEQAGRYGVDYAAYQALGQQATDTAISDLQARSLRDMKWLSRAKSAALRRMQSEAADKRRAVRDEVTREVMAEPINQARTWLSKGEMTTADGEVVKADHPVKLNSDALGAMFPEADLGKLRGMTAKDGIHPDLVAEMFGFSSGDEIVNALISAEPVKASISRRTNERMLERYGDLATPEALERAAEAAIHNDVRARFIATELKALTKAKGPVREIVRAAKDAATRAIAGQRVRDLRPHQYTAAEARANREAEHALAKDNIAAAAEAKRAAILNNQLARAAVDARERIAKNRKYLRKFDKPGVRKKLDLEYREQIDALLDRFDLRASVTNKALDKRESLLAFVERKAAEGYEPGVPEHLLNEALRQHYSDMSVEEFQGLADAVKSIEKLGRLKQRLRDGQKQREIEELADEAAQATATLPQRRPESNRGLTRMESKWLSIKAAGRSLQASLLKMEQMFDWLDARNPNGVFNRVVFRRIADAATVEADLQARVSEQLRALSRSHLADVTKDGETVFTAPDLIDSETGEPAKFTKKELLSLAGNYGNDSNLDKLARGEGWDPAAIKRFLDANMTNADWDYIAGIGRILESIWPEKLAMSRRLGNDNPEKVKPRAFATPHGEYPGWYWPMIYDPARAQDVAERGARNADALFENIYTRANTDTGRMNTRSQNYARPILLSLDAVPRVLRDEIHDLAYREAIIDADRFLRQPKVREAIIRALSQQHYEQLRPWLQSIANDRKTDMQALKWFDRLAHGARTRATMVGLGYRISTMVQHGLSAGLESVSELGPKWMGKGLADFGNPRQWAANADFIFERSGEMRHRMNEVDRDVREQLREIDLQLASPTIGAVARGADHIKARAYQGIAMLDMVSALPTWMGAYHKAMAPKAQGGLGMGEADAVYFADKTVRNAHGGMGIKDMAAVQRGPEFFKLFTMFYTFWNHNVNRLMDTARRARELPATYRSGDVAKFRGDVGTVVLRTLAYAFGAQAIHGLLHPPKNEDEEGWALWAAREIGLATTSGIPILRDVASYYWGGKGYDYEVTPAASMVRAVGQSGQDAMKAMAGEQTSSVWLKHGITTTGYIFGLPLGQPASTMQFLWDVEQGHQDPRTVQDWWMGVMHGRTNH